MSEYGKQGNTETPTSVEASEKVRNKASRCQNSGCVPNEDSMSASYSEIVFDSHYFNSQTEDDINVERCFKKKSWCDEDRYQHESSDEENEVDEKFVNNTQLNRQPFEMETPKRPESLACEKAFPYSLEGTGTVSKLGNMTHFVAENFQFKIKNSNPVTKKGHNSVGTSPSRNSTPSTSTTGLPQQFLSPNQQPQIDANVLNDIEIEIQYLAASVDILCENLCNLLHSISSITADNVEIHKNSVNKLTDNMDANIKCMYTIMAKTEEISKSMKPTENLAQKIREIKRLVDMLENNV